MKKNNSNCLNTEQSKSIKKEESEIVINSIVSNTGRSYGVIYYDTDKNGIFYKNVNGDVDQICGNRSRELKPIFNSLAPMKNKIKSKHYLYKGTLTIGTRYDVNDIIVHNDTLYICNSSYINKSEELEDQRWDVLVDRRSTVELWNPERRYMYGDIVIKENKMYIYDPTCIDEPTCVDEMTGWKLIFSSQCSCINDKTVSQYVENVEDVEDVENVEDVKETEVEIQQEERQESYTDSLTILDEIYELVEGGIFFGFFTNGSCCFSYMHSVGKSQYDFRCDHTTIEESDIWKDQEIAVLERSKINIPMNFVTKNSCNGITFDDDEKAVIVDRTGYYRMTYNITYYGSIYNVVSKVILMDINGTSGELIPQSINKSVNRYYDPFNSVDTDKDKQLDEYYEDIKNVEDTCKYINHTYPVYIDTGKYRDNICKTVLVIDFTERNNGKKIYICPLKTWLSIEKI